MPHDIAKGLEIWTLQTLLNISIMLVFFALGLVIIQPYYQNLKEQLTLRVSIEWLEMLSTVLADFFLAVVVLIGFLVLNPDIMSDIKIALPFVPFATILFAVALVKRLLCGGHDLSKKAGKQAVWLMFWANLLNIVGFSIVMEAPSCACIPVRSGLLSKAIYAPMQSHMVQNWHNGLFTFVFLLYF